MTTTTRTTAPRDLKRGTRYALSITGEQFTEFGTFTNSRSTAGSGTEFMFIGDDGDRFGLLATEFYAKEAGTR